MTPAMAATKSMNPFACEYAPLPSSTAAAPQAPPAAATRERSMREMLGAAAFVPRRTLHRVILDRPPLLPESTAGKSGANVAGTPLGEGEEIDLGVMAGKFRDMWKVHYLPRGDSWVSKSQADIFDPVVVASIEDIPTFWRVFNHLPTPQSKKTGAYYVFRDDIPPKWEDEANQGGGMLRVTVSEALVDEAWELLLLRAVGCSWVTPDGRQLVNGVVAKMRGGGQYALELWVKRETQEIQREMEELWTSELGGVFAMQYICFSEASAAGKSHQKPNKPSKSAGKVSHKDAVTGPMVVVAAPKSGYSNNHYKKGMNSFAR